MTKIDYLECMLNDISYEGDVGTRFDTNVILKREFQPHRSVIQGNLEVDKDVTHRIGESEEMKANIFV